jgi:hypothetical protein
LTPGIFNGWWVERVVAWCSLVVEGGCIGVLLRASTATKPNGLDDRANQRKTAELMTIDDDTRDADDRGKSSSRVYSTRHASKMDDVDLSHLPIIKMRQ